MNPTSSIGLEQRQQAQVVDIDRDGTEYYDIEVGGKMMRVSKQVRDLFREEARIRGE